MLKILDWFFYTTHLIFLAFALFGWIPRKLRKYHLILLSITGFSWFFLGIWYGWGYCFWTDWHWNIRHRISSKPLPDSFIQLLLNDLSFTFPENIVNNITAATFILLFFLSLLLFWRTKNGSADKENRAQPPFWQ